MTKEEAISAYESKWCAGDLVEVRTPALTETWVDGVITDCDEAGRIRGVLWWLADANEAGQYLPCRWQAQTPHPAPLPWDANYQVPAVRAARSFVAAPALDPLDEVIDRVMLRTLLARDFSNQRDALGGVLSRAQRAAVSAYRSAELRARIAAGPSADADRWRKEQQPQVWLDCAEEL